MTMNFRAIFKLLLASPLAGCASSEQDTFTAATPRLVIEQYFVGETRAFGLFEDRFGNIRRQFTVDINGTWDGRRLVLDERFLYGDGERDRRVWTITKTGEQSYSGTADDVIGTASGQAYGNALNWRYEMDLKINDGALRVQFDDWMFLQPSGVLLNRARVSKFGIDIGSVTLVFIKENQAASVLPDDVFSQSTGGRVFAQSANRWLEAAHRSSPPRPNSRHAR
jgi:hypothetical protein